MRTSDPRTTSSVSRGTVIRRKVLAPPLADRVVARPRVEGSIADFIDRYRVVVVSATAGAGKTTAVARAVRAAARPVAWLTVDRTDRAPGRLVTYLEAALTTQLPELAGVAGDTLAAGIPHAEAAGLLVEAVREEPLILVVDELERLDDAEEAWTVIEAVVRYAPQSMRLLLLSRRDLPIRIAASAAIGQTVTVGDEHLAFTVAEAREALMMLGYTSVDPARAVAATGGWVTGILFEAWDASDRVPGARGEADPLSGYLSAHILDQLDADTREFLVCTSLLDEVSAERAEALGVSDAAEYLAALRKAHLPVSWQAGANAMRPHPRFREYLLDQLARRGFSALSDLRRAHGLLLEAEGHDEEATEELLRAGATDDAIRVARRAIAGVVERLDTDIAERWVGALADPEHEPVEFAIAELMLAITADDYRRGVRFADQLTERGEREMIARSTAEGAALMAWCYFHAGRIDDLRNVLEIAPAASTIAAVRYAASLLLDDNPTAAAPPLPSGGALDALAQRARYQFGLLSDVGERPETNWVDTAVEHWRIAVLRATGQTQRALEAYAAAAPAARSAVALHAYIGPEVLMDAGRLEEARSALREGARLARASGSVLYTMLNALAEVELEVRVERNLPRARDVIASLEQEPAMHAFGYLRERLDTWRGLLALHVADDAEALCRLRPAVASMQAQSRILLLPTAAVYLAEAEWRAGNEDAADAAADSALAAAQRQGSNHLLLQAARDFPAVISRRLDAEPTTDSDWHRIGRALRVQGVRVEAVLPTPVEYREFGPPCILVDGAELARPITKSYELLSFLCSRDDGDAERSVVLDAILDGRSGDAAGAYLRKAVSQLRTALPADLQVSAEHGRLSIPVELTGCAESRTFQALLEVAARLEGEARLAAALDALRLYDRGNYLTGARSMWAEERRLELADRATEAREDAAEAAFGLGMYAEAEGLARRVLQDDPYREPTWRLLMRIASALGHETAVLAAYQGCKESLAAIETSPAPATKHLLDQLRR